ncbi:hypothetical protein CON36_34350 [Bacillus cereus]|uniref:Uncharacterized protein n=1 Tax=Bacillus cereus TaxID=1396 RepID=A0A9X6SSH6_BACCE|nr:hypothetical protein [Bacillus cereus]PDZ94334.1 hypothetical protein CON36_34350 [Bacillus cereus]PGP14460.1 hypothetical protein COA01_29280 [Bacillus cereus]
MKQRITVEQIRELNAAQTQQLLKLWKPELGDWIYYTDENEIGVIYGLEDTTPEVLHITWYMGGDSEFQLSDKTLPLLTIGEMMKFLYNFHACLTVEVSAQAFISTIKAKAGVRNKQTEKELCDALWEGIKDMLNLYIDLNDSQIIYIDNFRL